MSEPVDAQPVEPRGLSQADLLDMFDRTEAYPTIRAAIHVVLTGDAARAGDGLNPDYLAHSFAMKFGLREQSTFPQAEALERDLRTFLRAALHATATEEKG